MSFEELCVVIVIRKMFIFVSNDDIRVCRVKQSNQKVIEHHEWPRT